MKPIDKVGRRDKLVKLTSGQVDCRAYCPHCGGGPLDGATHMEYAEEGQHTGEPPSPGCFSICCFCAGLGLYDGSPLTLRKATEEEIVLLKEDKEQWRMVEIAIRCIKYRNSPAHDGQNRTKK